MHIEEIENEIMNFNDEEMLQFLFNNHLIKNEFICPGSCKSLMKIVTAKSYSLGKAWRCFSIGCTSYLCKKPLTDGSFFETIGKDIKKVFKIMLRWCGGNNMKSIVSTIQISFPTVKKIFDLLFDKMKDHNEIQPKLGGIGTIVQVDETMMNYKCKSHRGRSPSNRTDALCIVECRPCICKVWAQVIPDKSIQTILPIICERVFSNTIIHTDEHKSYQCLTRNGYIHKTVCHKYMFVDRINEVNTQAVESFNNVLKYEIKKRKGIRTCDRGKFLVEMVWKWNNKNNLWIALLELIKC